MHTDAPIKGGEADPDLLNRESFAGRIARGLLSVSPGAGFAVSLEGPWGVGKTSLLNLISREWESMPREERPLLCRFNPWMIGNADTLVQSFLVQLASTLGSEDQVKNASRAADELLSYSSVFTLLKFVPGAEPWASMTKGVVDAAGGATKNIASVRTLDIEGHKKRTINSILALGHRIVVYVDDLDRLPPSEVFQMVRLVKSVGDFPNVLYVLCFDPDYVAGALKGHGIESPDAYLDKVIQTRLSLPLISRDDLLKILNSEYDQLPEEARRERFPKQKDRVSEAYYYGLRDLLETPRDIKRLFNRIRFVEPGCRGEVNIADLLGLELLAIKAPAVYAHIKQQPSAYLGHDLGSGLLVKEPKEVVAGLKAQRQSALDKCPPHLREAVGDLLGHLFPLTGQHLSFSVHGDDVRSYGWISAADRLAIALSAGIPTNEVPYAFAAEFLSSPDRREQIVGEVLRVEGLARFLEHVRNAQRRGTLEEPRSALLVLARALDKPEALEEEARPVGFFEARIYRQVWWLFEGVLEGMAPEQRRADMDLMLQDAESYSAATQLVSELNAQYGAFEDRAAWPVEKRWVDQDSLTAITDTWSGRTVALARDGGLFRKLASSTALFRLKRFRGEELKALFNDAIDRQDLLDSLVETIGNLGQDTTGGRYARFRPEDVDAWGGNRLRDAARARLEDQTLRIALRNSYRALLSGRKTYLESGEESDSPD